MQKVPFFDLCNLVLLPALNFKKLQIQILDLLLVLAQDKISLVVDLILEVVLGLLDLLIFFLVGLGLFSHCGQSLDAPGAAFLRV